MIIARLVVQCQYKASSLADLHFLSAVCFDFSVVSCENKNMYTNEILGINHRNTKQGWSLAVIYYSIGDTSVIHNLP